MYRRLSLFSHPIQGDFNRLYHSLVKDEPDLFLSESNKRPNNQTEAPDNAALHALITRKKRKHGSLSATVSTQTNEGDHIANQRGRVLQPRSESFVEPPPKKTPTDIESMVSKSQPLVSSETSQVTRGALRSRIDSKANHDFGRRNQSPANEYSLHETALSETKTTPTRPNEPTKKNSPGIRRSNRSNRGLFSEGFPFGYLSSSSGSLDSDGDDVKKSSYSSRGINKEKTDSNEFSPSLEVCLDIDEFDEDEGNEEKSVTMTRTSRRNPRGTIGRANGSQKSRSVTGSCSAMKTHAKKNGTKPLAMVNSRQTTRKRTNAPNQTDNDDFEIVEVGYWNKGNFSDPPQPGFIWDPLAIYFYRGNRLTRDAETKKLSTSRSFSKRIDVFKILKANETVQGTPIFRPKKYGKNPGKSADRQQTPLFLKRSLKKVKASIQSMVKAKFNPAPRNQIQETQPANADDHGKVQNDIDEHSSSLSGFEIASNKSVSMEEERNKDPNMQTNKQQQQQEQERDQTHQNQYHHQNHHQDYHIFEELRPTIHPRENGEHAPMELATTPIVDQFYRMLNHIPETSIQANEDCAPICPPLYIQQGSSSPTTNTGSKTGPWNQVTVAEQLREAITHEKRVEGNEPGSPQSSKSVHSSHHNTANIHPTNSLATYAPKPTELSPTPIPREKPFPRNLKKTLPSQESSNSEQAPRAYSAPYVIYRPPVPIETSPPMQPGQVQAPRVIQRPGSHPTHGMAYPDSAHMPIVQAKQSPRCQMHPQNTVATKRKSGTVTTNDMRQAYVHNTPPMIHQQQQQQQQHHHHHHQQQRQVAPMQMEPNTPPLLQPSQIPLTPQEFAEMSKMYQTKGARRKDFSPPHAQPAHRLDDPHSAMSRFHFQYPGPMQHHAMPHCPSQLHAQPRMPPMVQVQPQVQPLSQSQVQTQLQMQVQPQVQTQSQTWSQASPHIQASTPSQMSQNPSNPTNPANPANPNRPKSNSSFFM